MVARPCPDAEVQSLAFALGHMQGSEQPVPDRKTTPKILVEVYRVIGMVDLVMRRAEDDVTERTCERNPEM